ncbi:hypothetical protein RCL1_007632 [Eukaryota sp. TZLM3-RCL]
MCECPCVQPCCQDVVLPLVGNKAPQFKLKAYHNNKFVDVSLDDYKGKWVVIVSYPRDFTFVCPTELLQFSDMNDEFAKKNCVVLGASVDSEFCHMNWCQQPRNQGGLGHDFKLPLLADVAHNFGRAYRCLDPANGLLLRQLVIIDDEGIIRHETTNDLDVGRNARETLRLLGAFQHSKKYGVVCPASFEEGSDAIDPSKAQEYFSKHG